MASFVACPEWRIAGREADVDRIYEAASVGTMLLRATLSATLLMTASAAIAGATTKPAKLEGMNYDEARSVVIGFGWKPFATECGGPPVDKATCTRYPELGYCQGNGRGFCGLTFAKAHRCLYLTTVESPPGVGASTIIYNVRFDRGACTAAN